MNPAGIWFKFSRTGLVLRLLLLKDMTTPNIKSTQGEPIPSFIWWIREEDTALCRSLEEGQIAATIGAHLLAHRKVPHVQHKITVI